MHAGRYQAIFDAEEKNWWYRVRRKLIYALVRKLSPGDKLNILDIGCGTGRNIMLLNDFGTAHGVDVSKYAIDFCKKRELKNVHLIKNNRYPFRAGSFDLVTCFDVLEHVGDEGALLSEAYRVLRKDGHILLTVAASPILWSKLDTDSHHLRRYVKKGLEEALLHIGFAIERISYFNYVLFFPILLVRLFQKLPFGKNTSWGIRPDFESARLNHILEPIFTADINSLTYISPPFGVSLFAVARKL